MESDKIESREDSKESGVSFKSDGSKLYKYFKKKLSFRVRLKKSLSSGISCVSVRSDDSPSCTADVKETPPSPEEKQEDLIGPFLDSVGHDEDLVKSSDDQMSEGSMVSFDTGVSFKTDQSKDGLIDFKYSSPPRLDFSSSEEEDVVADDEGFFEPSKDLMALGSARFSHSGVPFKSNRHSYLPDRPDFSSSEEEDAVEDLLGFSDDLMASRSMSSFGSGLCWMNDSSIRFQQRSLPARPDFSSSEKKHIVAYGEDWIKSPYSLMVKRSMESFDSGVSFRTDQAENRLNLIRHRIFPRSVYFSRRI